MKNNFLLTLVCLLPSIFLPGCGAPPPAAHADHPAGEEPESIFVEGKGVLITPACREFVGLQTVPVERGHLKSERDIQLQIYRHAGESALVRNQYRPGHAYASAFLPAEEARTLKMGQELATHSGHPARIHFIDRQLEAVTGENEVLVEIPDPDQQLEIGAFVQAQGPLPAPAAPEGVIVPDGAILRTARGDFAYAANQDYFYRTPVTITDRAGGSVLVTEGLYEGDIVAGTAVQELYLIELQTTNGGRGCAHGH